MAGNAFCFTRFLRHHFANMNNPIDQAPAGSSSNYSGGRQATGTALVRDDGTRLPDFNQANRKTLMMGGILVANGKLRQDQIDLVLNEQRVTNLRFGETAMRMRLVSHADVEEALAIQFGYSSSRASALALPDKVTSAVNPYSPFAEALRGLRSQLMTRWFDGSPDRRTLAITSVDRGDGKSFVCANLGVAFSQIGQRTLVIDGDLRHPTQHLNFGLRNQMGLSGILSGRAGLEEVMEFPTLPNLAVLPSGPQPPNPQELLGRDIFMDLLQTLAGHYDVILIDTPSAQETTRPRPAELPPSPALSWGRAIRSLRVPVSSRVKTVPARSMQTILGAEGSTSQLHCESASRLHITSPVAADTPASLLPLIRRWLLYRYRSRYGKP